MNEEKKNQKKEGAEGEREGGDKWYQIKGKKRKKKKLKARETQRIGR